jgi:hypothetical protein
MAYDKEKDVWVGYIYKIYNKENGKVYIGQTRRTIEERWKQHIYDSNKNKPFALYMAVNKYGLDCFLIEELKSISCRDKHNLIQELNEAEIFYINKYHSNDGIHGYNMNAGGECADQVKIMVKQFDIDNGALLKIWDCITDAAMFYEVDPCCITECCKGKIYTSAGYVWRYMTDEFDTYEVKNVYKKICQYNKNGLLLNVFKNATEAAIAIGSDKNQILNVCHGKGISCRGYIFRFFGEPFDKYPVSYNRQNMNGLSVNCYTQDDIYITTYPSMQEGARYTGLKSSTGILGCVKHQYKTAGGYKWFYANDPAQPDKSKIIV